MQTFREWLREKEAEELNEADEKSVLRDVLTQKWADKYYSGFNRVLYTAGDDVGLHKEGEKKTSENGYKNFRNQLTKTIANVMKPTGKFGDDAQIAKSITKKLSDDELDIIINNLRNKFGKLK